MGGTSESCIEYEQRFDRVRYLGSVGINKSLLPYPPEHRELIVSAAIHKLFNETDLDVPPTPILAEIDQLPHSTLRQILGETRIARNPRARATTRVTTKNIEISTVESQSNAGFFTDRRCTLAHHQMDVISFASLDMSVYVSYVAKDTGPGGIAVDDSRACHVIECEHTGQANEMYAAVESAFNQRTSAPVQPYIVPEASFDTGSSRWDDTLPQGGDAERYYNTNPNKEPPLSGRIRQPMPEPALYANQKTIDQMIEKQKVQPKPIPRSRVSERSNYVNQDVVDEHNVKIRNSSTESMSPSPNSFFTNSALPSSSSTSSFGSIEDSDRIRRLRDIVQSARNLEYFHTFSSNPRKAVEDKLKSDGDFLLREASVFLIPNQIRNITLSVLNMVKNKPVIKHVLLIMSPSEDADNPIHTLDKSFNSIAELISHYMEDGQTLQMPRDLPETTSDPDGDIKISNPIKRNIFIQKPFKNENLYV